MFHEPPETLRPEPSGQAALLRHAVDASGEVVFLTGTDGVFTYVNRQFTNVYGYEAEEVVGRETPRLLKSGRQSTDFYETFWGRLLSGGTLRATYINRSKTGRLVTVETTTSAVIEDGRTIGYLSIQRDVTLQREAERAAELARVAIEHAPDAVCWFDTDGRILYVNRMTLAMTGYDRAEIDHRPVVDFLPGVGAAEFHERWPQLLQAGALQMKTEVLRRDGSRLPVELRVTRVTFGEASYGCALLRDVSEQQRLEAELQQAQKMEAIGRLAGGVAHDFNNLLTAIAGYADLALAQTTERALAADIREIQGAAARAGSLTKQLLAFSRRQPSQPRVVDANDAVAATLRMIARLVGEHVRVAFAPSDRARRVRIDPGQFDQVLINLAVNARDAMPKGGTLTFTISDVSVPFEPAVSPAAMVASSGHAGAYIAIAVTDTGTGIPLEIQARVLEPFFTTKPEGKGTGLGLSTVYGIVGQAGGFMAVDSIPGSGTTVTIYLPRVEDGVERDTAPAATVPGALDDETVLVVEDDVQVRHVAARFLAQRGYRVLVAHDVADALRIARSYPRTINLLLTDIVMPSLNGPDLAQRIVEERPTMRVLYVSGYEDARSVAQAQRVAVLRKPFTSDGLASAVRQALHPN